MAAITEVNVSNFDALLANDLPVLIDFWAPWCGPCRMVSPIVDQLADELDGRLVIGKCNVDENQDIAMKYGVMSIPTLVILKGGQEVNRIVGAMPKPALAAKLRRACNDTAPQASDTDATIRLPTRAIRTQRQRSTLKPRVAGAFSYRDSRLMPTANYGRTRPQGGPMHDVGMNMSQLAMSVKQVDNTIELARSWSHDLLHATETYDMERIGSKLAQAMRSLDEARAALEGYEEAIEADHNSVGTVRLV